MKYHPPYHLTLDILSSIVPASMVEECFTFCIEEQVWLSISKNRSSKLGDFSYIPKNKRYRISINSDLNKELSAIVFWHEAAHIITHKTYKNKVKPHGPEWKLNFQRLLYPYLSSHYFLEVVLFYLAKYLDNPKATLKNEVELLTLFGLNNQSNGTPVKEIPIGEIFDYKSRVFKLIKKRRTRFLCQETNTFRYYSFPADLNVNYPSTT